MSLESDVRRLSGTRPFNLLPREALQLLAFSCERRQLKAGQTLFAAGEPADGAYFLLEGEIALFAAGEERRVAPGALIGETALIVDVMRGAGARASVDSTLLRISRDTFRRVLGEFPASAVKVHASISVRTRHFLDQLEAIRARAFET
ncbi:MAG: Crp/Fnr family transcriptional regulator [Roseiarcus sp.]